MKLEEQQLIESLMDIVEEYDAEMRSLIAELTISEAYDLASQHLSKLTALKSEYLEVIGDVRLS